nr:MAG TPA: hypothetical protein [Bacteriophage sp.]
MTGEKPSKSLKNACSVQPRASKSAENLISSAFCFLK